MVVEIEGYFDNVVLVLFGGMVVLIIEENKIFYDKVNIKNGLKFVSIVLNFRLFIEKVRSVLLKEISMKDGVYNVLRVVFMVVCFSSGRYELIKYVCKDVFY